MFPISTLDEKIPSPWGSELHECVPYKTAFSSRIYLCEHLMRQGNRTSSTRPYYKAPPGFREPWTTFLLEGLTPQNVGISSRPPLKHLTTHVPVYDGSNLLRTHFSTYVHGHEILI